MLKAWRTALLDLVYPPKCPVCRCLVAEHGQWCLQCLSDVLHPRELNLASHHLNALDGCQVVADYSGGLKRLLHDMKFRHASRYAVALAWLVDNAAIVRFGSINLVVPVPLHAARLAQRGYNQTTLIFRGWAEKQGLTWQENVLTRLQPTVPQWELASKDRRRNIKGAFQVTRREIIQGKHILLVDDIVTTGATLQECANVLKTADAAAVYGLALASGAQ